MIHDNKQMFFDNAAMSDGLASNVIPNFSENATKDKEQNAVLAPYLYAKGHGDTAASELLLETSVDKDFTTPIALGIFAMQAGKAVKARVPVGALAWYRLTVTTSGGGALTAGLVVDADIV